MERIADALLSVVRLMVDKPGEVKMEVISGNGGNSVQFRLTLDPDDVGKVIGKQGRTVRALRTLLLAMSMTSKLVISLEIGE